MYGTSNHHHHRSNGQQQQQQKQDDGYPHHHLFLEQPNPSTLFYSRDEFLAGSYLGGFGNRSSTTATANQQQQQQRRRRRRIRPSAWGSSLDWQELLARYTTRAVLLSPLVILSLWSLALVLFHPSSKHLQQQQQVIAKQQQQQELPVSQAVRVPVRPRHKKQGFFNARLLGRSNNNSNSNHHYNYNTNNNNNANNNNAPIVEPPHPPLPPNPPRVQQLPQNGVLLMGQSAYMAVDQSSQQQDLQQEDVMQDQQPRIPYRAYHNKNTNVVIRPRPTPRDPNRAKSPPGLLTKSTSNNNNKQNKRHNNNSNSNFHIPVLVPLGQEESIPAQGVTTTTLPLLSSSSSTSSYSTSSFSSSQQQFSTDQQEQMDPPPELSTNPSSTDSGTTVLYYDPALASSGNGQLVVPDIVYDMNGNPVALSSLGSSQIFMEPQPMGAAASSSSTNFKSKVMNNWKRQVPQDANQVIIISTVAVMALLVGALSARRMRSRSFLSACIENESLHDGLAYDQAYTTFKGNDAAAADYATFSWRGDLEKFDV